MLRNNPGFIGSSRRYALKALLPKLSRVLFNHLGNVRRENSMRWREAWTRTKGDVYEMRKEFDV